MKFIFIGSDRKIFDENSVSASRMKDYAKKAEELHLIVFSLRRHKLNLQTRENLKIYPTNSICRLDYVRRAVKIGLQILKNNKSEDFVISAQDPFEAGLVALKLKQKTGIKIQIQIHTDLFNSFFKKSFLNKIRLKITSRVLPEADGVRVVSERIKKSLLESGINLKAEPKVLPIMNFSISKTDEDLKHQLLKIKGLKIGILARLEPEKNLSLALLSFAKVSQGTDNLNLLVAGDGSEKKKLKILAGVLGIRKKVYWLGEVVDSKTFLEACDIYLQTSDFEGFCLALWEAKQVGLPIISTDVGLIGSLIKNGEGAFICPPRDGKCLAGALNSLVREEELRRMMADFNKKSDLAEDFPRNKEEYLEAYFNLLKL